MNKLRILSLLLAGMILCGCAAQPVNQPEASVSTVATAFTEPESSAASISNKSSKEFDQEIFDEWKRGTSSAASMGFGFEGPTYSEDHQSLAYFEYTGGEMHVQVEATSQGIPEIGVLLFLDGCAQPYRTETDSEYKYVHLFPLASDKEVFDLWFIPVTGAEGDCLDLNTLCILDPEYKITDGPEYGRYTCGSTGHATHLIFQSAPPDAQVVPGANCVLESSTTLTDLTDEEYRLSVSDDGTNFIYKMSINSHEGKQGKSWGGDKYYNTDLSSPVQVDIQAWGDDDGKYGLILYVNNEPLNLDEPILFQTEPGKKITFHFSLDLSEAGEYPVIYGVIAARNYWENGPGTGARMFSYETVPAFPTEAKDLWDLLGIQEITQN